ncbi:hypothetical protein V8E51_013115 [Hyaloscypha variabilis]
MRLVTDYYPHFSIGMRFDLNTGGAVMVNKCRAKYIPTSVPWSRMRMFYQFPHENFEFCRDVLAESASRNTAFTVDLGNPTLVVDRRRPRPFGVSWQLPRAELLLRIRKELRTSFEPIIEEIEKFGYKNGVYENQWPYGRRNYTVSQWRPTICMWFTTLKEAEEALKHIKAELENRP